MTCSKCGEEIPETGPRIILHNDWLCGACMYSLEHGRLSYEAKARESESKPRLVQRKVWIVQP